MTQPATPKISETPVTATTTASPATRDRLATDDGQITVAEGVVQKIAGKACREIAGVHAMGTGGTRAFGVDPRAHPRQHRPERRPGRRSGSRRDRSRHRPGHRGRIRRVSIAELGRSIQRNVKQTVERMTGLRVVEVNIAVDDVYLPTDGEQDTAPARVS